MGLTLEIISRVDHWRFQLEYRAQKITAAALALHWCCCYRWIFAVVERRDYLLHRPSEGEEEDGRFVCQCLKELPSISILKICRFVPCPLFSLMRKLLLLLLLLWWCQRKKHPSIFKNWMGAEVTNDDCFCFVLFFLFLDLARIWHQFRFVFLSWFPLEWEWITAWNTFIILLPCPAEMRLVVDWNVDKTILGLCWNDWPNDGAPTCALAWSEGMWEQFPGCFVPICRRKWRKWCSHVWVMTFHTEQGWIIVYNSFLVFYCFGLRIDAIIIPVCVCCDLCRPLLM